MRSSRKEPANMITRLSDSPRLKAALLWAAGPLIVILTVFAASLVFGKSNVINARWNSAILPSGLRVELKSVVRKIGNASDPNRKQAWALDGIPLSASEAGAEGCQSAAPDMMSVGDYEPQDARYLVFRITSPSSRQLSIHGFIPSSDFNKAKPTRSGICLCSLNLSLEEGSNAAFESQVACIESKLSRYILEVSDAAWIQAASLEAIHLEGKKDETKEIKLPFGTLRLTVHRYDEYTGPEMNPDYVWLEVVPSSSSSSSEYRILPYDRKGVQLQFPYRLKRMPVPNQTDFPIDLWNTVGRIEIVKRGTEFIEFTSICMSPR